MRGSRTPKEEKSPRIAEEPFEDFYTTKEITLPAQREIRLRIEPSKNSEYRWKVALASRLRTNSEFGILSFHLICPPRDCRVRPLVMRSRQLFSRDGDALSRTERRLPHAYIPPKAARMAFYLLEGWRRIYFRLQGLRMGRFLGFC
jgi:hypothetical protein